MTKLTNEQISVLKKNILLLNKKGRELHEQINAEENSKARKILEDKFNENFQKTLNYKKKLEYL